MRDYTINASRSASISDDVATNAETTFNREGVNSAPSTEQPRSDSAATVKGIADMDMTHAFVAERELNTVEASDAVEGIETTDDRSGVVGPDRTAWEQAFALWLETDREWNRLTDIALCDISDEPNRCGKAEQAQAQAAMRALLPHFNEVRNAFMSAVSPTIEAALYKAGVALESLDNDHVEAARHDISRLLRSRGFNEESVATCIAVLGDAADDSAESAPIDNTLDKLIAEYDRRAAEEANYEDRVHTQLWNCWTSAQAAVPHIESEPVAGRVLSSAKNGDIGLARCIAANPQYGSAGAAQRFIEAVEARQESLNAMPVKVALARSREHLEDVLGMRRYAAASAVNDYQPKTVAELHTKLAFMIKTGMAEYSDTAEELLADIAGLLNKA